MEVKNKLTVTKGQGQWGGAGGRGWDFMWEREAGQVSGEQWGKNGDNCN